VVSAVLGSASHLAWDSLTHADSWGPRHWPALRTPLTLPVVGPMVAHRALQHGSSVVGLIVLAVLVARWLARSPPIALPAVPRVAARGLVAACVIAATTLTIARLAARHATDPGNLVVGAIAGVLAGVLVASAVLVPRARRLQRAGLVGDVEAQRARHRQPS
jgi:hypothetical protein